MRCSEVMKRQVVSLFVGETCKSASRKMRDGNVGFLPVCDRSGRVVGTLTDRDIAIRLVAEGRSFDLPVSEVMTREVVWCHAQDDLEQAEQRMGAGHKSRILVLDDEGKLQGVISLSDLAKHDTLNAVKTMAQVATREFHEHH